MRPTPLFGGVGWELAAVDSEVLLANEAELGRVQQHIAKQAYDLAVELTDEACQRREVRPSVRRKRHEHDVAAAGLGQHAA